MKLINFQGASRFIVQMLFRHSIRFRQRTRSYILICCRHYCAQCFFNTFSTLLQAQSSCMRWSPASYHWSFQIVVQCTAQMANLTFEWMIMIVECVTTRPHLELNMWTQCNWFPTQNFSMLSEERYPIRHELKTTPRRSVVNHRQIKKEERECGLQWKKTLVLPWVVYDW